MIPKNELDKAISIAEKYKVGKLYLISSTLRHNPFTTAEYDFAVSDVPRGAFFKFYSELFTTMSKTVNLIDLSGQKTKFKDLVIKEGKLVYDPACGHNLTRTQAFKAESLTDRKHPSKK